MVFNATFNNIVTISWPLALLGEETGGKTTSHWQTLSHNVVSNTPRYERDSNSQLKWWWALIAQVRQLRQRRPRFPCMEHRGFVASSSCGLTFNQMYRVGIIISVINDVTSQWKSCFQSLGLWSFIIVFYWMSRFLHSAIIEECYIFHPCMTFYTAIVLFEQSKCVDSIFTSDKRSLTVYNI